MRPLVGALSHLEMGSPSLQSARELRQPAPAIWPPARGIWQRVAKGICQLIARIALFARQIFAAGSSLFRRGPVSSPSPDRPGDAHFLSAPSRELLLELPCELQLKIYSQLKTAELAALSRACPKQSQRQLITSILLKRCQNLLALLEVLVNLEPRLCQVFPQLPKFLQWRRHALTLPVFSGDLYLLSRAETSLRESLRMLAIYWAYGRPRELESILIALGFTPNDNPECENRFEPIDTNWTSGPMMPHLFDRAIISSNLQALRLLLKFVPLSKQNLNILSETSSRKKNRADLHLTIMCLFYRDTWSTAESARFRSRFGTGALRALGEISPVFQPGRVVQLQSEETDRQIWQLMHGPLGRDQVMQCAKACCDRLIDKVRSTFIPPLPGSAPICLDLETAQIEHMPFAMLGRFLKSPPANSPIDAIDLHARGLDLAESHFAGERRRSSAYAVGDLLCENLISKWLPRAPDELTHYRSQGRSNGGKYHRNLHLLDALYRSLFGDSSGFFELREAVKHFLYCSAKLRQGAPFPDARLTKLFNPLCDSNNSESLVDYGAHLASSKSFLMNILYYQWLLTAIVSKLFERQILLVSNAEIEREGERDAEDIHIAHCACAMIGEYSLEDVQIDFSTRQRDQSWTACAHFSPSARADHSPHLVVAKYGWKSPQQYFTPL